MLPFVSAPASPDIGAIIWIPLSSGLMELVGPWNEIPVRPSCFPCLDSDVAAVVRQIGPINQWWAPPC
jgi:hypothetical protein